MSRKVGNVVPHIVPYILIILPKNNSQIPIFTHFLHDFSSKRIKGCGV
uniref:Uncharacterized protein n=1 Tax=Solanum lycopersicum TaxID=4081 RepID=K4C1H9_SOLLC